FSYNWFDLVVLAMLIVGIVVGRKRGMSLELLTLLQWLVIVFVGAMVAGPFGKMLADLSGISPVVTYITAYLLTAIVIKVLFVVVQRMSGEKHFSRHLFGRAGYYLRMVARLTPFAVI